MKFTPLLAVLGKLTIRKASLVGYSHPDAEPVADLTEANIVTSKLDGAEGHYVLVDVDYPVHVIPSSTPGHSHLYIEKAVNEADLMAVLDVLASVGIVEEGYAQASRARGYSALRLPWIKKPETPEPEPKKTLPVVPFLGTPDPF